MKLTIFSVEGGRRWREWLGADVLNGPTPDNFYQPRWYQGEGRFLALIHYGSDLKDGDTKRARRFDLDWLSLPEDIRHRVWWLFYSGSGYRALSSGQPNVHYLAYLVQSNVMYPEDTTCFRTLIRELSAEGVIDGKEIWKTLYPSSNATMATLLALLSARDYVSDLHSTIAKLLDENRELTMAHHEYLSKLSDTDRQQAANFDDWVALLKDGNYEPIQQQLVSVLGAVPD